MNEERKPFETWAVVEIMGHQQFAGRVTEEPIAGQNLLRVDIPEVGERPAHTKYFGGGSIYAIHPCSEDLARAAAAKLAMSYGAALLPVAVPDLTNALATINQAQRIRESQPALAPGSRGFDDDEELVY